MSIIFGINRLRTHLLRLFMRFDFIGKDVIIHRTCDIHSGAAPYIHLGNGVRIAEDVWLNIPFEAPSTVKGKPIIKISDRTEIGRRCIISGIHRIEIGPSCLLAPGVFIADHNHKFANPDIPIKDQGGTEGGTVIIEEGSWCGYNSAIITDKGREIRVGRNSVIGANAVVTKSCPPCSVLVGSPARNIKL